jgi:serine/threonine protein kinase/Tol biopolymer transport system component
MLGSRLGVYEITDRLGAGAMGEVYRARDTRLGRDVAVKVLPPAFTKDPDRLARFEREAKLLASLNHPNVATVFGIEESGDVRALVMELVEGENLSERIGRGAIPFRESLEIGRQIAVALDAAHDGGVIHRDLKPANVVITSEGIAKVLDFGLAKTAGPQTTSGSGGVGGERTVTSVGTAAGIILGTAAYMSPEQARGKAVDRRTDVWSFGCVVYEMLTGATAFGGETVTDVLAAIVHKEPDWSRLPAAARPRLERLLRRCLAKEQRDRASDLGDVALVLREIASECSEEPSTIPFAGPKRSIPWPAVAAAALVALAVGTAIGAKWLAGTPAGEPPAFAPSSFRQLTFLPGGENLPAISRDGQSFAYVAGPSGKGDIFVQRIDGRNATNLTAHCPLDDFDPAFSPDGRFIAYHSECSGGGLFVMGASGESARKVADSGFSPAWSPDGKEIAVVTERLGLPFGRNTTSILSAVAVETGKRRVISEHDAMQPAWSPDGKRIAFWGLAGTSQRDLYTVAADGSQAAPEAATRVTEDPDVDWSPAWSPDGRALFFSSTRGGTVNLWRIPIDPETGTAAGSPAPVTAPSSWVGWISLSGDGKKLVFVDRNARTSVLRAPFDSARAEITGPPAEVPLGTLEIDPEMDLSPDGSTIAFANSGLPQHLHLVRADGSGLVQLTDGANRDRQPAFSPDGRSIAFQTNRWPGSMALIRTDGSGLRPLVSDRGEGWFPLWSPDGRRVAVSSQEGCFFLDPSAASETGATTTIAAAGDEGNFWASSFSPDGTQILGGIWKDGFPVGIEILSLEDRSRRNVLSAPGVSQAQYLPDGRRAVVNLGDRLAVRDLTNGSSRDVLTATAGRDIAWFTISRDGRWIAWFTAADESDIWMATFE